jgi:hypothetical protein
LLTGLNALLIVLVCSGCASVALSASTLVGTTNEVLGAQLTPDAVGAIALNALEAWNAGDYAGWTRDWSPTLRAGVRSGDFEAFRDRYFDRYGSCFAIIRSDAGPSLRTGYVRWAFDVECRSGRLRFTFAFPEGSKQIESVYVEPLK